MQFHSPLPSPFLFYITKWIYEVYARQTWTTDRLASSGKKLVSAAQLRYEVLSDRLRRPNTRKSQNKYLVQINSRTEYMALIHIGITILYLNIVT